MGKEYSADLQKTKSREMLSKNNILPMPMGLEKSNLSHLADINYNYIPDNVQI